MDAPELNDKTADITVRVMLIQYIDACLLLTELVLCLCLLLDDARCQADTRSCLFWSISCAHVVHPLPWWSGIDIHGVNERTTQAAT